MVEHNFHKLIGEKIYANFKDCRVLRDTACGGNHILPLFCSPDKSNKTEFCDADMLLIKDNKIKVIFEIEESDVKPTQICGKFLASALSLNYLYDNERIEMDDNTLFIQILDNSKLEGGSSKEDQWKNLEKAIVDLLPVGKMTQYKLFFGNATKFNYDEIMKYLRDFLQK